MPPQLRRSERGTHVGILPPEPKRIARPFMAKSGLSLTRRLNTHVRLWSTAVPWAADRIGSRHSDAECLEV